MEKPMYPMEDPRKIHPGMILSQITIHKVSSEEGNVIKRIVGTEIHYAAVGELKVKSVELNEGETGVIINRNSDNIRIQYDINAHTYETDGSLFDSNEKAMAAAAAINSTNRKKAEDFANEFKEAGKFLEQLLRKGA